MGVFKEIPKADGSGITTFYRLDNDKDTVETTSTGGTETMIDYNKALNKPSINNVVLVGNKTLDELGIQPKGDYITEIPSEYITEEELNQKQYATESYVLDKIANIEHFSRQIVDELPLVGKDNVIYLVRKEGAGDDIYNEYIWTGTSYELFGSTATDLSDYYNKDSVNKLLDTKVDKQEGKGLSTNDYTNAEKSKLASLENYDDSELRAAIDSLHNYDDTEIRQEINKLSNESEAMSEKIEDIDKTNDYKLEAVRLIKSGDYWIWKDSADNLIDYFKARDLLGTENCILIMEQLDSDGKSIPADYKIDGERIRILYKDLENLNHEMYMGPPDKDEVEGADVIIDNGAEATLFALSGDGKSEQVTTTGANILPYPYTNTSKIINGVTFTVNKDGSVLVNGTASANANFALHGGDGEEKNISGNYLFGGSNNVWCRVIHKSDIGYKVLCTSRNNSSTSINKGSYTTGYIELVVPSGYTANNELITPMMTMNITNVYEPYTGGQPSPSPDYPQEINSIEGSVEFDCTGKNLLPITIENQTQHGITITNNKNGTITINGTADVGTEFNIAQNITLPQGTYTNSSNIIKKGIYFSLDDIGDTMLNGAQLNYTKTFTISEEKTYSKYFIYIDKGTSFNNETFELMVERGTEKTNWEPYIEPNQVTFNLNDEKLRSVGDVKDELVVDLDTGDYYKVENVGEFDYNGLENSDISGTVLVESTLGQNLLAGVFNIFSSTSNATNKPTSNKFATKVLGNASDTENPDNVRFFEGIAHHAANNTQFIISIEKTRLNSVDLSGFIQYFSNNPAKIQCSLATSTTKKLGTLSAEDLAKLSTFDGYNNLFINTNLGYMNIRVTYSTNTNYNENIILGDDSYYYGIVDNKQSLPEGKAKGTLCQTKDTKDFYIYNGEEWVPVDKTASFDLSNYLSKDNTTPYSPSDRYNPATKQYVDTNIQGLRIPTKVSQLENDSKYITENTNTLVNYYNKNNTYNKKEVDALIDSSGITPVSVTLNGQKTTDANFYAPASGGTANQILISQGDAAPVWQNNTAVQTVNQDIKLVISDTQPEAPSSGFILWVDSTK